MGFGSTAGQQILVSENDLFLTLDSGTSSAQNENLRLLLNRNIPLIIVGNMASETTFVHWKVVFLMSKSEKK